jgi:hypothetical protein
VGVLKFLVQKGKGRPSDNAGPLNLGLAGRLEVALVLALPATEKEVRILHDASATVAGNRRANHTTAAGRREFFAYQYRPAWGVEKGLPAEVLLTGLVRFGADFRSVEVTVQAADRKGLQPVCTFKAAADARLLTEAGISFASRRGLLNAGEKAVPLLQKEAPIDFAILYGGKKVPLRVKPGVPAEASVPEPSAGERLTFRLRHKNRDRMSYGVVLRINGKNTVFPKVPQPDDLSAYKWLVKPGADFEIRAFQETLETGDRFEVAKSWAEVPDEVRYSEHRGTFTVVIFRQRQPGEQVPEASPREKDVQTIGLGSRKGGLQPRSLSELQKGLRNPSRKDWKEAPVRARGAVLPGAKVEHKIRKVSFQLYPEPVYSITIRYGDGRSED